MPNLFPLVRPLLLSLPEETAHNATLKALELGLGGLMTDKAAREFDAPIILQRLWNRVFPNPIGLAAGFDKDARVPDQLIALGFGFVEVGTLTPRPQPGHARPRIFRLSEDSGIINRMGFPNEGFDAAIARLARRRRSELIGINIGANRASKDVFADFSEGIRRLAPLADYLVVNVSSPNTPGLRDLQRRDRLDALLTFLLREREQIGLAVPLLVKIAPDLSPAVRGDIAAVSLSLGIDGLVVSNTTTSKPPGLVSVKAGNEGGLSGRPLFKTSTELLSDFYKLTGGRIPIIGVGGISTAEDAYVKIRAGASLVQLYSAFVMNGPKVISEIKQGLVDLLKRDGFTSVEQAVGAAHRHRLPTGVEAPFQAAVA